MKWILVLILFVGDEVTDYALLVGSSQEKCEKARAEAIEKAKAAGVEVWGKCVEMDRVKQPIIPPEKMNQDGPAPDGKRRGQTS